MTRVSAAVATLAGALLAAPAQAAAGEGGGSTFLFYAINFVILVVVLFLAGRKPIQAFFKDRHEEIQGDLDRLGVPARLETI